MPLTVEGTLRRSRVVSAATLILLTLLAWAWLLSGAGMGMAPLLSLAPPGSPPLAAPSMPMEMGGTMEQAGQNPAARAAIIFSMWWSMMIAMMLPSAAPTILLYGRAAGGDRTGQTPAPATGLFLAGYLAVWGGFSAAATMLHLMLERIDLLGPMTMASQARSLSAAILVAAGLYQLGPLKDMCLRHCRNPAQFLSRHYRPGGMGALRMGLVHGAYCTGCCWLLMMLLFVGGVMNLAWIALLTVIVALEKLLPGGRWLAAASGIAFLAWGALLLLK